jgi:RNA polymerase sigma-70 factor, ECF subfamily
VGSVTDREQRFETLLHAVASDVRRYLTRRAGEQVAEEVLADVATVLWRRLDDVPNEEPLAWCYGVARRCLANHLRGEKRRRKLVDRLAAEPPRAEWVEPTEAEDRLRDALARLKADDREVLTLWAWEGLEAKDIATSLGISANAAAIRLHRARRRLAERVTATADTEAGERRVR